MKSENILTLEECKYEVASKNGYDLDRSFAAERFHGNIGLLDEAAELYASQFKNQLEEKNKEVERLKAENNRFNKELDIVHRCLTELCDIDTIYPVIRRCLDEIELLNP